MPEHEEIAQTVEHLQRAFEDLAVRGLRSAGPDQLARLTALGAELERIGASHLAGRVAAVVEGVRNHDRAAAAALLRAQASLRVFERILTLQVVGETLAVLTETEEE